MRIDASSIKTDVYISPPAPTQIPTSAPTDHMTNKIKTAPNYEYIGICAVVIIIPFFYWGYKKVKKNGNPDSRKIYPDSRKIYIETSDNHNDNDNDINPAIASAVPADIQDSEILAIKSYVITMRAIICAILIIVICILVFIVLHFCLAAV